MSPSTSTAESKVGVLARSGIISTILFALFALIQFIFAIYSFLLFNDLKASQALNEDYSFMGYECQCYTSIQLLMQVGVVLVISGVFALVAVAGQVV
jgi:hypothetical protein